MWGREHDRELVAQGGNDRRYTGQQSEADGGARRAPEAEAAAPVPMEEDAPQVDSDDEPAEKRVQITIGKDRRGQPVKKWLNQSRHPIGPIGSPATGETLALSSTWPSF